MDEGRGLQATSLGHQALQCSDRRWSAQRPGVAREGEQTILTRRLHCSLQWNRQILVSFLDYLIANAAVLNLRPCLTACKIIHVFSGYRSAGVHVGINIFNLIHVFK